MGKKTFQELWESLESLETSPPAGKSLSGQSGVAEPIIPELVINQRRPAGGITPLTGPVISKHEGKLMLTWETSDRKYCAPVTIPNGEQYSLHGLRCSRNELPPYLPQYPYKNEPTIGLKELLGWIYMQHWASRPVLDVLAELYDLVPIRALGRVNPDLQHWLSDEAKKAGFEIGWIRREYPYVKVFIDWAPPQGTVHKSSIHMGYVWFRLNQKLLMCWGGYSSPFADLSIGLRQGDFADPRHLFSAKFYSEIVSRLYPPTPRTEFEIGATWD